MLCVLFVAHLPVDGDVPNGNFFVFCLICSIVLDLLELLDAPNGRGVGAVADVHLDSPQGSSETLLPLVTSLPSNVTVVPTSRPSPYLGVPPPYPPGGAWGKEKDITSETMDLGGNSTPLTGVVPIRARSSQ